MARKRKVRLLGDDLFARQGSLGVSLSGQTSLVLDPTDRGLHPDNVIYVGAQIQPTAGNSFQIHLDPSTQNIQFVEDDGDNNLVFQHYAAPYEHWKITTDVDLKFEATAGSQIHFENPISITSDSDGDKIFFYSTAYKISLSPYTFDLTSDKDFRFHSDTVPDLFIIEGDYGDCVSKQDLRAGRDVISGGVFKFATPAVGDKILLYGTGPVPNLYSMGIAPDTLTLQSDRYIQMGSDSDPDSFIFDGDTGDLTITGTLTAAATAIPVVAHDMISGHTATCSAGQFVRGTGANTFAWGAIQAGDLPNHDIVAKHTATCLEGQYLRGSGFTTFGWSAIQAHELPTGIDAAKIGAGTITNTVFGYLNGVSSSIQTQLNGKAASSHDLLSSHTAGGLTSGHVLRATGATSFAFGAIQSGDLPSHTHSYLPLAGGTMAGNITLNGNNLLSVNSLAFENEIGDKIAFWGSSYKASIDTLKLIFQSDRYIQMGSDTDPDSFIFDGDTGDLTITGTLTAAATAIPVVAHDMISGHTATCSSGQYVRGTGSNTFAWGAIQAGDLPTAIDAAKIADGTVSNAEFQYLNSVSGNIQTQIDSKAAASHSLTASHTVSGLTSGHVLRATGSTTFAFGAIQSGDLPSHTHTLAHVTDVTAVAAEVNLLDLAGLTAGHVLRASGAAAASWAAIQAGDLPAAIDAAKLADGSISNTEFQYLNNVSSNIQTQLNGKAASSHDLLSAHTATCSSGQFVRGTGVNTFAWGAIAAGDLPTAIDAAKLANGLVSNAEFQYLDGVTSAIQTQIDGKAPTSHAVNASTYGYGDATYAGHVRVGTGINVSSGTISVAYGTSGSSACVGNDARLSDARTPVSHDLDSAHTGLLSHEKGGLEANVGAYDGLLKISAGATSAITDNSTNWNAAYTDRLKWDGGATGLVAATGRTSLGLGNVENTALSTWAGSANITTVGTLASGSIPFSLVSGQASIAQGGTNQTSYNLNDFLIYNGTSITTSGYNWNSFASAGHLHTGVYAPNSHNHGTGTSAQIPLFSNGASGTLEDSPISFTGAIISINCGLQTNGAIVTNSFIHVASNYQCNFQTGVTGTVANPTSITVTGGIVTAIS